MMKGIGALLIGVVLTQGVVLSACASRPDSAGSFSDNPSAEQVQRGGGAKAPYYTGNGGKGMSIAILVPDARGLAKEQDYLPALVQGVFVSDFSKYSALSVLDRQNLDRIISENYSGYYEEDHPDLNKLGHLLPTDYIMSGAVMKTGAGYTIQMQIVNNKTSETMASYSGNCTAGELDNFAGIKRASLELLTEFFRDFDIQLSENARSELSGVGQEGYVRAETALAKGVTAQRGGSTVAAYNYLTEAASLNAGLPEADARLAALTKQIETGSLGEDIRNDIALRNAWKKLLDEALIFYEENPPFNVVYRAKPITGKINYEKNTAELSFEFWLEPNARLLALRKLLKTLDGTGKMDEWGFYYSHFKKLVTTEGPSVLCYYFEVKAELIDGQGEYLAASREERYEVYWDSYTFRSLKRLHFPNKASLLTFTVDAQKISGDMRLVLTAAGKMSMTGKYSYPVMIKNALDYTLIKAADKAVQEYFSGKRNYELSSNRGYFVYTLPA